MKRLIGAAALALAVLSAGSSAQAGIFSDDLARCLVKSSNDSDKSTLMVWIYSAMSTHPGIKAYSKLTPEQTAANTKAAGELFARLLSVDCHDQTVAALKNEGAIAMEQSFETLGRVAMQQLMGDPSVSASMGGLSKVFESDPKMVQLVKESGLK